MNTHAPSPRTSFSYKRLTKPYIVLYIVGLVSMLIYVIARNSVTFSDVFNRYISTPIRALLAFVTCWFPFSLAEAILLSSPLIVALVLIHAIRHYADSWKSVGIYMAKLLAVAAFFASLFIWSFGIAYQGSTLDQKLGLDRRDVSVEELKDTALFLAQRVNEEAENVCFRDKNFSVMPHSYAELNRELLNAYRSLSETHSFIPRFYSRIKPIMLSEPMSYTHITGVYTYFTGEANLNVNFPDYTLPYTAAHELAHQRGIAREDEANFVAFLVCTTSSDPYVRYSGYLNLYEYVAGSLYAADADAYYSVVSTLKDPVRDEMRAYSAFYEQYRESTAGTISNAVNDTYLKVQGTVGTKSYGMVVDLTVAYYKNRGK